MHNPAIPATMPRQGQNVGNQETTPWHRAVGAERELRPCMEGRRKGEVPGYPDGLFALQV